MSDYFGDASYWLALVDENDQYHDIATQYSAILDLENARIVTTQLVLNEVLAPRSGTTPERRQDAVHLVDRILATRTSTFSHSCRSSLGTLYDCSAPGPWTRNGASLIAPASW